MIKRLWNRWFVSDGPTFYIRSAEGASCMATRPGADEDMRRLTEKVKARFYPQQD